MTGRWWREGVIAAALALGVGCVSMPEDGATEHGSDEYHPGASKLDEPDGPSVPLDSREYKVLLDPELFDSSPADFAQYWLEELSIQLANTNLAPVGDLALAEERVVQFYDNANCELRGSSFVLRDRADVDPDGKRKLTLKYRSRDPLAAAQQELTSTLDGAKEKLEEDIVPPYTRKYSHSISQKVGSKRDIDEVKDASKIFPNLEELGIDPESNFVIVGDVIAREDVYRGAIFELGGLDAEVSLTLWYLDDAAPVVAEASFVYGDGTGEYPAEVESNGVDLFVAMRSMNEWRSTSSTTKTALVYDSSDCE